MRVKNGSNGMVQCIPFSQFLFLQVRWLTIKHKPGINVQQLTLSVSITVSKKSTATNRPQKWIKLTQVLFLLQAILQSGSTCLADDCNLEIKINHKIISGRKYIPHSQSPLNVSVRMYIPHSRSKENVFVHRYITHNFSH